MVEHVQVQAHVHVRQLTVEQDVLIVCTIRIRKKNNNCNQFNLAVCSPTCSNSGTCSSPGTCTCPSTYSGTRCTIRM